MSVHPEAEDETRGPVAGEAEVETDFENAAAVEIAAEDEPAAIADTSDASDASDATATADYRLAVSEEDAAEQPSSPIVEAVDADELKAALAQQIDALGSTEDEPVPGCGDLPPAELRGVVEALLLVAKAPLPEARLVKLLPGTDANYLHGFLEGLADRYRFQGRGWDLRRIGGGWQLLTSPQYHAWVRQLDRKELPTSLGKSAMETLAIIAYKQPVSRGQIEDIRGVQSGPMVRQLMDLKLVQMVGRSEDLLGKPILYGTTEVFLDRFGLGSPDDLPRRHELGI